MPAEYVSAEWVHDETMGTYTIKAIGDDDSVWWIGSVNSDVPPWPAYMEEVKAGTKQIAGTAPPETEPADDAA
jgi:hypothetical protein